MRHVIALVLFFCSFCLDSQVDTIQVNTFEDAIDLTFGQIPQAHYPSGILMDKVGCDKSLEHADGSLNDSLYNVYHWYYFYSKIYFSQINKAFLSKTFLQVDSLKNSYIDTSDALPIGILNFRYEKIRDSAYVERLIDVQNHRLIDRSENQDKLYESKRLFCASPLNEMANTLHPRFMFLAEDMFSNDGRPFLKLELDAGDGLGYREAVIGQGIEAQYTEAGYKNLTTRMIYQNGDTLYARSQLYCNDANLLSRVASSSIHAYDFTFDVLSDPDHWPTNQFSVSYQFRKATCGVWQGCGNSQPGNIRKPVIIFSGYNPKNGKDLVDNGNPHWINDNAGPLLSLAGWRGPLYETYNGFFTDASIGPNHYGGNGSEFLEKLRAEGYDIIIVKMHEGIGYLQLYAEVVMEVIKRVNTLKSLSYTTLNPGAALDPEAPGYPNTTLKTKPHHENIVMGYSAGALASRMGLLLMEYLHKTKAGTPQASDYPHHNTKTWVAYDCENQGSNVPIGFQMFADFEQTSMPTGNVDAVNMLLANGVINLLKTRGVATQNTLYHIINTNFGGGQQWNATHHADFNYYFDDLTAISNTDPAYANLKGYPVYCRRIAISPGNAFGISNALSNGDRLVEYQQPLQHCVFNGFGFRPYKHARALPITHSSGSEHVFTAASELHFRRSGKPGL